MEISAVDAEGRNLRLRTCLRLGGHAQTRVVGHCAVRCRWESNPAGPPTGRHCAPNSGCRCMRLTPWSYPSSPRSRTSKEVQVVLGVVAATYSSPAVLVHILWHYKICICRVEACRHAGGHGPSQVEQLWSASCDATGRWDPSRPGPIVPPVIQVGLSRARMTPGKDPSRPEPDGT